MKKLLLSIVAVTILVSGSVTLTEVAGPTQPGTGTAPTSTPLSGPTQPGTGT
ncbi:hypothetical protein [Shouchella miscanthi]|uniref:hypothetical protein n=1 Tax=Shouchella miscanthi TaxID=2598861 RepID=UPI001643CE20|nr:hypothetical protein [Shouchella miscanthi]